MEKQELYDIVKEVLVDFMEHLEKTTKDQDDINLTVNAFVIFAKLHEPKIDRARISHFKRPMDKTDMSTQALFFGKKFVASFALQFPIILINISLLMIWFK